MTDTPDDVTRDELLLLDAMDGDRDALAAVAADPRLAAELEIMIATAEAVKTAPIDVPDAVRSQSIAAAMSVYDDMTASAAAATEVAALEKQRRSLRLFRGAGVMAASAVAVVGVLVVAPNLGGSDDDSDGGDVATAAVDTTAAASAGGDSQLSAERSPEAANAPAATTAAPETTAPPTTVSAAMTTTTVAALETAPAADDAAGEDGEVEDTVGAPEAIPTFDPRLFECASQSDVVDNSNWFSTRPAPDETGEGPTLRVIVMQGDGLEIRVEYNPQTCEFVSVGEPDIPSTTVP